jgi:hypothetical protein
VDFAAIGPTTFGNTTSHAVFFFDNTGVCDTDILANTYRKTVDTVKRFEDSALLRFSGEKTSMAFFNGMEGQYPQILRDSRPVFSSLAAAYGLLFFKMLLLEIWNGLSDVQVEMLLGITTALLGSTTALLGSTTALLGSTTALLSITTALLSDTLSAMRLCGLSLEDTVPDHSTLSCFRSELTANGAMDKLLSAINAELSKHRRSNNRIVYNSISLRFIVFLPEYRGG